MTEIDTRLLTGLRLGLRALNLTLDDTQTNKLIMFIHILMKWNRAYNLTAIIDPEEIMTRHILDSLTILPYLSGIDILDVGSGAGFPGIPLAVASPNKKFILLDGNGKKTRFLTQAIGELHINNATVVKSRVEDYKPSHYFDVIMTRAFSPLDKFILLTRHLVCPNGELLVMKGLYPQAELEKIGGHTTVYPLSVPCLDEQRHLVSIKGLSHE